MTNKIFGILIALFFILPVNSYAQTKKNTPTPTPTPTISASKILLPQMSAGQNVTVTSPVNHDLFAGGRQVNIDTTVSGDTYVGGGQVNVKGVVDGNLIVAGGNAVVSGEVKKNLIIVGGEVVLDKSAIINGYVMGGSGKMTLSGTVNGPVRLAGGEVVLTDTAQVGGDLEVYANQSTIDPAAKILGEKRISITPKEESPARSNASRRFMGEFSAFNLFYFISQVLVLLVLLRMIGNYILNLSDSAIKSPLSLLGWGLVGLIIIPFLVLIFFITIIGIPLGILTAVIYGLGLYFATLFGGIALGRWFYQKKWINRDNIYLQSIVGYLILFIIGFIPFVGPIVKFIAFLFGLGIIFQWERSLFFRKTA